MSQEPKIRRYKRTREEIEKDGVLPTSRDRYRVAYSYIKNIHKKLNSMTKQSASVGLLLVAHPDMRVEALCCTEVEPKIPEFQDHFEPILSVLAQCSSDFIQKQLELKDAPKRKRTYNRRRTAGHEEDEVEEKSHAKKPARHSSRRVLDDEGKQ